MHHVVGGAGGHQGVVKIGHLFDRVVELPAELSDVADPQCEAVHAADLDLLGGEPRPGVRREVGVGTGCQHVTGLGASDGEDPHSVGPVVDDDFLAG